MYLLGILAVDGEDWGTGERQLKVEEATCSPLGPPRNGFCLCPPRISMFVIVIHRSDCITADQTDALCFTQECVSLFEKLPRYRDECLQDAYNALGILWFNRSVRGSRFATNSLLHFHKALDVVPWQRALQGGDKAYR